MKREFTSDFYLTRKPIPIVRKMCVTKKKKGGGGTVLPYKGKINQPPNQTAVTHQFSSHPDCGLRTGSQFFDDWFIDSFMAVQ